MSADIPSETNEPVTAFDVTRPRRIRMCEVAKKNAACSAKYSAIQAALIVAERGELLLPHALGPLVVPVPVGLGGHDRFHAALGELFLELFPDKRILVRIFDLILGAVLDLLRVAVELHRRIERQIAR